MATVAITNLTAPDLFHQMQERLRVAGHESFYEGVHPGWDEQNTKRLIQDAAAVIAGGDIFSSEVIQSASKLRIIARVGMGYDQVDVGAATRAGVMVTNTPGVATDAVADQALGLLIAVVRDFPAQFREVASGEYQAVFRRDLKALTLGLLGCGRIGSAVATRAQAFGMRVIAFDPPAQVAGLLPAFVEGVSRDHLLAEADVISLHSPLSPESTGIVDAAFLAGMKPGSYLINTARGGLVVESDLLAALESGHIAGAGLDCLAFEPPEGSSLDLVRSPKVIATPHCAGATVEAKERGGFQAVDSVIAGLQGQRPPNLINPEVLASSSRA